MRPLRSHLFFASCCLPMFAAAIAVAQDPTPPTAPPAAESRPEQPAAEAAPERRSRRQAIVIQAGTVHPVAGPAIQDGVVVVRGERIIAVGKQSEIETPGNAVVRSFPTGHVYPGLVDAATDAYTDLAMRGSGDLDAGATLADDLHLRHDRDDELVQAGITTAYVTVRSPATFRGQGAVVRPRQSGFDLWEKREHAGVHLRMTNGPGPTHALQRQQQLEAADAVFEGLEEFRKARTDHDEALKKYEKEFADYLAWHQKKKDAGKPADKKEGEQPAAPAATPAPAGPPGESRPPRRGGNRGGGGGGNEPPRDAGTSDKEFEQAIATLLATLAENRAKQDPQKQDPPKQDPKPADAPPAQGTPSAPAGEKKDEAPKRPVYPKPPARDPQKEALLAVIDGELPLRVEAHRPDELRAALRLQRDRSIPLLVLEQAYGAGPLAADIARQGASVVLTEVLPNSLTKPYDVYDPTALPALLQAAGVPFAIASGSARRASLLPLMAAAAAGRGLDAEAALRAITLTPAEILGIAKDTGSLRAGKLADVLVCDRPLFATDSRVLLVLAKGHTEYEAK